MKLYRQAPKSLNLEMKDGERMERENGGREWRERMEREVEEKEVLRVKGRREKKPRGIEDI